MQTTIIKGEGKDKSLLLLSGLHGNEYTPLFVLNLLRSGDFLNNIVKHYKIITIVECFNTCISSYANTTCRIQYKHDFIYVCS